MREHPERFARNILVAAFAVFLVIAGATVYGIQWFIFQSRAPMDVTLSVSRGTVSVLPPDTEAAIAVTDERADLEIGTRISTDASSQGMLRFEDPRTGRLVAEWVFHPDSEVALDAARAPRFGLNRHPYSISGTSLNGDSEALLLTTANRPITFNVQSEAMTTTFLRTGHYLLNVSNDTTQVVTREGLAEVSNGSGSPVQVDAGKRAIAQQGDDVTVEDHEANLVTNGNFMLPDTAGWEAYVNGIEPLGDTSAIIFEGRPVVLFDRPVELFEGTSFNHGEAGVEQVLDLPATDLTFLELRTTFRVTEQSLSTCGVAGSECPLMVRMDYVDREGVARAWIHGFYVTHNPALEYPLRCDSCAIDHERIAPDRWYTFESGNLMSLLPGEQKPDLIESIQVYASGHAFKTYVTEMSLLAAPAPELPESG